MNIPVFDVNQNLEGKRIVLRSSLNVPIENGKVTNTFRLEHALTTMETLAKKGARTVVLAHIGRESTETLRPVWEELRTRAQVPIHFCKSVVGVETQEAVDHLKNGEVLVVENTRKDRREVENDEVFAKTLASYGDVYINDAFSSSHRAHASIVGIPKHIPGFIGPVFEREMLGIEPAKNPENPSLAIVGGAKFVTKEPLLRHLVDTYDRVFIGGAIANDFIKAQGHNIGKSLVSNVADVSDLLENKKIIIPEYVVVEQQGASETKHVSEINDVDIIYDIAEESLVQLLPYVEKAQFVLWNGPLGSFEKGYSHGTEFLAQHIAQAPGASVVGGGDTIAAIEKLSLRNKFTHVSTSGGAMLRYIADGTLVGIDALVKKPKGIF